MRNWFASYKNIDRSVFLLIIAECCLQLINATFMLILLIYMQKSGYPDYKGADFIKYRFLSVLLFSVPVGLYIRNRPIRPLFYFASLVVPISSLVILFAVEHHYDYLIYGAQFIWGIGFSCIQIAALPYILRNSSPGTITEGISLSHATWSIAGLFSGILIYALHGYDPISFHERNLLFLFAIAGFAAALFVAMMDKNEKLNDPEAVDSEKNKNYDWNLIIEASIPIVIIAVGAGLTIPFISLFFFNIHGIDSDRFSLIAALALGLVVTGTMLVPQIKNRLGYRLAVPLTQSLAVLSLIALAFTELWKGNSWALYLAIFFYAIRQPLMNMAGPMTSEVTMNYVGKRNQEMMSALSASIWSGSWFISAYMFELLRKNDISYMSIFLITSGLYAVGIIAYVLLFRKHEQKNA